MHNLANLTNRRKLSAFVPVATFNTPAILVNSISQSLLCWFEFIRNFPYLFVQCCERALNAIKYTSAATITSKQRAFSAIIFMQSYNLTLFECVVSNNFKLITNLVTKLLARCHLFAHFFISAIFCFFR